MNKAYKERIATSKARLDEALKSDAKRFGHHGVQNLIETVRQRHNVQITEGYAQELLSYAGFGPTTQ